jgi:uncharacterized membrane protein YhhN
MRPWLAISILFSALNLLSVWIGGYPGRWIVKTIPVAALAVAARGRPELALGLLLSATGDALLAFGGRHFLHGLVAFLCAHIAYIVCFLRVGRRRPAPWAALAVLAFSGALLLYLWPGLGGMRTPVVLYSLAITWMTIASFGVGGMAAVGALLFLLSDAVLAVNRFRAPVPLYPYLNWTAYYGGQLLLALALGQANRRSK